MLKQFFDISTGFRFSKLQFGSVPSIPVAVLALFNHYFYKKLSLYIQLPNIYLGVGLEFGPQRI
jgi:hypothetical protein